MRRAGKPPGFVALALCSILGVGCAATPDATAPPSDPTAAPTPTATTAPIPTPTSTSRPEPSPSPTTPPTPAPEPTPLPQPQVQVVDTPVEVTEHPNLDRFTAAAIDPAGRRLAYGFDGPDGRQVCFAAVGDAAAVVCHPADDVGFDSLRWTPDGGAVVSGSSFLGSVTRRQCCCT